MNRNAPENEIESDKDHGHKDEHECEDEGE
jgi:hypothetical protein